MPGVSDVCHSVCVTGETVSCQEMSENGKPGTHETPGTPV